MKRCAFITLLGGVAAWCLRRVRSTQQDRRGWLILAAHPVQAVKVWPNACERACAILAG